MSELIKTPLHSLHIELGAKMVGFAGYTMPVQYPLGIIQEHLHCRTQAGFFDISHMGQFLITGTSVAEELEKLVPSNIINLTLGQQRYTILNNKNGGIIDDIIITRIEQGYLIVVNAACKEKDFAHLQQHLSQQCNLTELHDQTLFSLQGPAAENIMTHLSEQAAQLSFMHACTTQISNMECIISRCGYTGEDGFEISINNQHAEILAKQLLSFEQVRPIGLGARDTLRLEAGLSLYGHEINESISAIEAGLKWIFRKDDSDYIGKNILSLQLRNGSTRKRIGLIVEGKIPVRQNTELFDSQNNSIGIVTSGSFSPTLGKPIALALINNSNDDQTLYAKVRNRLLPVNKTQLPFVQHRYQRG